MDLADILSARAPGFLSDHFLIAMPGIDDTRFARAVILLLAHSEDGAIGFVVNHEADIAPGDVFARAGLETHDPVDIPVEDGEPGLLGVVHGGPVEASRGFVLHSPDYRSDSTLPVSDGLSLTSTLDVLRAIAHGRGPERALLSLGYAGWGAGQLEGELRDNVWLTVEADLSHVFDLPVEDRYAAALGRLGVSPEALSGAAGTA